MDEVGGTGVPAGCRRTFPGPVGVVTAMLSPQAALQQAGIVPQNVNYAIKSEFLHELLRYSIGAEAIASDEPGSERSFKDLVSGAQESVVIVMTD